MKSMDLIARAGSAASLIAMVATAMPAAAQQVDFGGQIRPRFELRDPAAGGRDSFTSMRVRADLTGRLPSNVGVLIQVQDVRLFGEESSTLTDFQADNFDLHQGFLSVGDDNTPVWVRVGRQETIFGGHRLMGSVDWTQQGRSFDGVRMNAGRDGIGVDLVAFKLGDRSATNIDQDADLLGAYGSVADVLSGTLEPYVIDYRTTLPDAVRLTTLGVRQHGTVEGVRFRWEASIQTGENGESDVSAYMFGARAGGDVGERTSVTLWYDYLSGDDDPTDDRIEVFNTLFATNHKFYGFADMFLNIPVHTGGGGLQDFAVKGALRARPDVTTSLDLHLFRFARQAPFSSGRIGEEVDLTVRYAYAANLDVVGGVSYVVAGDGFVDLGRLTEDQIFLYLMLNSVF